MKLSVLSALVASSSQINLKDQRNSHLSATYILNDAVATVSSLAGEERLAEQETNKDYVTELDRKIHLMTKERKHVIDGEVQAQTMIT